MRLTRNLLRTRRLAIHARLLDALAAKDAAPELLAHHAAMAGMNERAARYWLTAGEQASARSANKEAINHLKAGVHLIEGAPDTNEIQRLRLDLNSGHCHVRVFTCQLRCILKDRTKENQSLGTLKVGTESTENGLFLANVTMPLRGKAQ